MERPLVRGQITCPAGDPIHHIRGGIACRCRIAHETIDADGNLRTLVNRCMGEYQGCETWRIKREAEMEGEGVAYQREINADAMVAGEL